MASLALSVITEGKQAAAAGSLKLQDILQEIKALRRQLEVPMSSWSGGSTRMADGEQLPPGISVWGGVATSNVDSAFGLLLKKLSLLSQRPIMRRITVNFFDGNLDEMCHSPPSRKILCTSVQGMKGLFWKRVFTPEAVAEFTHIWFFDSDMEVWPFDLLNVVDTMRALGAPIAQPAILKSHVRSETASGRFADLRTEGHVSAIVNGVTRADVPLDSDCVAIQVPYVEVTTPVFEAAIWGAFNAEVLSQWPDSELSRTVWMIDSIWCGYAGQRFKRAVPCIVVRTSQIIHGDTRTLDNSTISPVALRARSMPSLPVQLSRRISRYRFDGNAENASYRRSRRVLRRTRPVSCWSQQDVLMGPDARRSEATSHATLLAQYHKAADASCRAVGKDGTPLHPPVIFKDLALDTFLPDCLGYCLEVSQCSGIQSARDGRQWCWMFCAGPGCETPRRLLKPSSNPKQWREAHTDEIGAPVTMAGINATIRSGDFKSFDGDCYMKVHPSASWNLAGLGPS